MVILYLLLFCTSYYTYSDRILTRLVESCFVANKNCAKDKFPFSFEPYNINIHQKFMQQQDQDNLMWERKWKMNFHVIPHTHHHKEKANQPLLTTHSRPRPFKEWGGGGQNDSVSSYWMTCTGVPMFKQQLQGKSDQYFQFADSVLSVGVRW